MSAASPGYSGTSWPKKLGIKENCAVLLVREPEGFRRILGELPPGVILRAGFRSTARADVILLFAASGRVLQKQLGSAKARMKSSSGLWIAWPKKNSPVATDLARDSVLESGLRAGLVDIKVCAIDETWSGLRFVFRTRDRR